MILIADAGSTKIEWCVIDGQGAGSTFETPGANALMLAESDLRALFDEALAGVRPDAIHYYGAGCATAQVCAKVAAALPPAPLKEVQSDMAGAARALLGNKPGIAAILGTGSNSAQFDGTRIVRSMPPLGYILGDEGSGAALGKRLLRTVYRRPDTLRERLETRLDMTYGDILDRVYRQPAANAFLASLVGFIADNREELAPMIADEFGAFFNALKGFYGTELTGGISLVGGVAAALEPELRRAAANAGIDIMKIQQRPMTGLIEYHSHEQHI